MIGRQVAASRSRRAARGLTARLRVGAVASLFAALLATGLAGPLEPARPAVAISTCAAVDYCSTLTFNVAGDGSGTIVAGPNRELSCTYDGQGPTQCSHEFIWLRTSGSYLPVPYTWTAAAHSGICTTLAYCADARPQVGDSIALFPATPASLDVSFWLAEFTVTGSLAGTGSGQFDLNYITLGESCPPDCSVSGVAYGTTVILSNPKAAPGSTFAGWGGSCTGRAAECDLTVLQDSKVWATFNLVVPSPSPARSAAPRSTPAATSSPVPGSSHPTIGGSAAPGPSSTAAATPQASQSPASGEASVGSAPLVAVILVIGVGALVGLGIGFLVAGRRRST